MRYVGELIAVVCAADRDVAKDAAGAVVVEYELASVARALEQDATPPILHDGWPSNSAEQFAVTVGDGAVAPAGAAVVAAQASDIDALRRFAQGLSANFAAVRADARSQ